MVGQNGNGQVGKVRGLQNTKHPNVHYSYMSPSLKVVARTFINVWLLFSQVNSEQHKPELISSQVFRSAAGLSVNFRAISHAGVSRCQPATSLQICTQFVWNPFSVLLSKPVFTSHCSDIIINSCLLVYITLYYSSVTLHL